MDRRGYLSVAWAALLPATAGCLGGGEPPSSGENSGGTEGENGDESETAGRGDADGIDRTPAREDSSGNDETFDPDEDIAIVLGNSTSEEATVRLTVSRDGEAFFETEVAVSPEDRRTVDPAIHETGRYELEAEVDGGPDASYPFGVERYDLEMGSNLIVVVDDEDLRVMIEE